MPLSTKQLKQKINSVKSLQKITKAMEMIAKAKMKKSIHYALATRTYAMLGLELLVNLSLDDSHKNIFIDSGKSGRKLLVVYIASDKGLCGSYNTQIFKSVKKYFSSGHYKNENVDFVTIGKYAGVHARKFNGQIIKSFNEIKDLKLFSSGQEIYDFVISRYKSMEYKKAVIIYTNYISVFSRETIVRELLPLSNKSLKNMIEHLGGVEDDIKLKSLKNKDFSRYIYEPSPQVILDLVVPELVATQIYQSLLESKASEESGRMVAMKSASENGEKMRSELEITYNRARQAAITKEIIEISSAAEAIN